MIVATINNLNPLLLQIAMLISITISSIKMKALAKLNIKLCITATIISYGVSYFIFTFSVIIISSVYGAFMYEMTLGILDAVLLFLLQAGISICLFRVKRIKKGFPFLFSNKTPFIDLFASSLIILFYSIISGVLQSIYIVVPIILAIVLTFVLLVLIWKNKLTKLYIKRQKDRELEYLYSTIEENKKFIDKLLNDNEKLSRVMHKDNKLIPAMKNVVIQLANKSKDRENQVIEQLQELLHERTQIVQDYQSATKNTTLQTGYFLIDAMSDYMSKKAMQDNVNYTLQIDSDMKFIADGFISDKDFCTIMADLIENALIAVKQTNLKNISVQITKYFEHHAIIVSDSGNTFKPRVLYSLGIKRITTHSQEGGSGIGLMSLFDLKNKSKASLIIHEYSSDNKPYTKDIIIVFDNKNEYRILSPRSKTLLDDCIRKDIIFESV